MNFISLILFLATCLITNSHFDPLYGDYAFLSTGGMIGNGLFFFVSGYTLYKSIRRVSSGKDILYWFLRRILRIYPAYWIYFILNLIINQDQLHFRDLFITSYWFLNTIVICYFLYFIIVKFLFKYWPLFFSLAGLLFIALLFYYSDRGSSFFIEMRGGGEWVFFRYFYLFQIMLIGGYTASREMRKHPNRDLVLMLLFLLLYFGLKVACVRLDIYYLQSLVPLLLILLVYFIYKVVRTYAEKFDFAKLHWKPVYAISKLTLEIYIVQFAIIRVCSSLRFPLGFFSAVFGILLAAFILHQVTQWLMKPLMSFLQKKFN